MIGHDAAIQALNSLSKASVTTFDPTEHSRHMMGESDRMQMILVGSTVDDILLSGIKERLPTKLNCDDRSSLYGFDGPLGTFGSRTLFALAMGIIDQTARKQIDIMRSTRNAAAHSLEKVDFSTKAVRMAMISIVRNETGQRLMGKWDALALKKFHGVVGAALCRIITEPGSALNLKYVLDMNEEDFQARRRASRETPPAK